MPDLLGPAIPGATTERPADNRVFGADDTWIKDCTSETSEDGTPLGAAFLNGLLAQFRRAIRGMGIAVNNADDDMLLKAIQKAGSGYVPMADARSLLPFYPEIETVSKKLAVSVAAGQVAVDANQTFIHRGIARVSTSAFDVAQRTFATVASKTYHLRWHAPGTGDAVPAASWPAGRFVLKDLANAGYNPTSAAETDPRFDRVYDDMLIARVVTNGSNVPTVTTLINRDRILGRTVLTGTVQFPGANQAKTDIPVTLDLAATPVVVPWLDFGGQNGTVLDDNDLVQQVINVSRYGFTLHGEFDYATIINMGAMWQA